MRMIFAAIMLLTTTACCGKGVKLAEGTWKLFEMKGIPAEVINADQNNFTLTLDATKLAINGRANCNNFFGHYETEGRDMDLDIAGMTRMACPDMQYESLYVENLDEVDRYKIKGGDLILYNDKSVIAVFRKMTPEK